jgi:hypothetical protein
MLLLLHTNHQKQSANTESIELVRISSFAEYGDSDIVVDDNGFVLIPGEYEHWFLRPWFQVTMPDGARSICRQRLNIL